MRKFLTVILLYCTSMASYAQDDLWDSTDTNEPEEVLLFRPRVGIGLMPRVLLSIGTGSNTLGWGGGIQAMFFAHKNLSAGVLAYHFSMKYEGSQIVQNQVLDGWYRVDDLSPFVRGYFLKRNVLFVEAGYHAGRYTSQMSRDTSDFRISAASGAVGANLLYVNPDRFLSERISFEFIYRRIFSLNQYSLRNRYHYAFQWGVNFYF